MSDIFFKGYVETRNKTCVEKFKGRTDFKTLEQVQSLPEYAGILSKEAILIDVDDAEQAEILMNIVEAKQLNCRVYQTTRGKHFLFKNTSINKCGTKIRLACGLTADIKVGVKNSYSVLKFNNEDRFIEWDINPGEEYQEVPKWLFPVNLNMNFLDMEVGDGRNQSLFNYILTLQATDFTVEEARETIRIINQFILKEPLSEKELEIILRDDAFKKPIFFKGTSFLFDKFATYIKNNNHIIKINNQLHIYKDGVYIDGYNEIEAEMIKHISSLNRAKRNEVLAYLMLLIRNNTPPTDANMIAFKNGIYNIKDDTFIDFAPNIVITNKINWDYNPAAYSELVDTTLNKIACQDNQVRQLLEEAIGYCLYRRNELGKAFILIGDRSNGKSTFLDMVKTMLGDENIASLDMNELSDRFKTAELFGKLANIGDDIGDEFIANAAIFRKLVTGERINVERKGQDPFEFNNYSKMLFSANNIPRIKDKTGAVQRRLTIIPFDAKFSAEDPDYRPYIKYELREQDCIEYLILLGIEGLKRVLANRKFSQSSRVEQELQEYEESNNPIIGFIKEVGFDEIDNEPTKIIYKRYQVYCIDNNLQPLSNIEFSKQLKKKFNFDIVDKKIDGKKYRIFIRKD
jgi:putative DNA primase/helicase